MNLKLPEIKKCCCYIPLEIGAKIIAYTHLIFALIFTIQRYHLWIYLYNKFKRDYTVDTIHLEMDQVAYSLQVVFGIYVIIGIYEKNPSFIFSWVLFEMTSALLATILIVNSSIYAVILSYRYDQIFRFINPEQMIEESIFAVVYTYFSIIFYSLYKKMQRDLDDKERKVIWRGGSATLH